MEQKKCQVKPCTPRCLPGTHLCMGGMVSGFAMHYALLLRCGNFPHNTKMLSRHDEFSFILCSKIQSHSVYTSGSSSFSSIETARCLLFAMHFSCQRATHGRDATVPISLFINIFRQFGWILHVPSDAGGLCSAALSLKLERFQCMHHSPLLQCSRETQPVP